MISLAPFAKSQSGFNLYLIPCSAPPDATDLAKPESLCENEGITLGNTGIDPLVI